MFSSTSLEINRHGSDDGTMYWCIGNSSGICLVSFLSNWHQWSVVGIWTPTTKMIGDIPDFNLLIAPILQPRQNAAFSLWGKILQHEQIIYCNLCYTSPASIHQILTNKSFLCQLHSEASCNLFQFTFWIFSGVDLHPGFCTTEWDIDTGTFVGHQRG